MGTGQRALTVKEKRRRKNLAQLSLVNTDEISVNSVNINKNICI
jgi:hypothetical protein